MTVWRDSYEQSTRQPRMVIWSIAASLIVFLVWAAFAWVDEIVSAPGTVVSSSKPQIIQNLEGGILSDLYVSEGDIVQAGQVLAQLQSTHYQSMRDDFQAQVMALQIRKLRLEAEMKAEPHFVVPLPLTVGMEVIIASESALLYARQADFSARRDGAQAILGQAATELEILERMYAQEVAPLIEVTRARKVHHDAQNKLHEVQTQTELDLAKQYSEVLGELASLEQKLKIADDQLLRTTLLSPMRGVVNKIAISTIGGVVRSGEEILQIVPLDEELYVDAKVKPRDIAVVRLGQKATVKLSAYDYTIWGSLDGEVVFVSADTFTDDHSRASDGAPYYIVTLKVDLAQLSERQRVIEVRPGMQAEVELEIGQKTILTYLLKPLYKSSEAFRER